MKKSLFVITLVILSLCVFVGCKSEVVYEGVPYMMKGLNWYFELVDYNECDKIKSITFSKTYDESWGKLEGVDLTIEGNGNVMGYVTGTDMYDIYIVGNKIEGNYNCNFMFGNMSGLTTINNFDLFDTSKVTNISYMFTGCKSLKKINFSSFNTSKVTDMYGLFFDCTSLTSLDLSNFDTSKVTDMGFMFGCCTSLTDIDLCCFNTSKVTNMTNMFYYCFSLETIKGLEDFDTSKVGSMYCMFERCYNLISLDVKNFDTSNVTNMGNMFQNCTSLTDLKLGSKFTTSKVTSMRFMFNGCCGLTSLDLSNFDTSKVTDMMGMFRKCLSLTSLNLSNFDTSKVTNMSYMFECCLSLKDLHIEQFTSCSDMKYMFGNADDLLSGCISLKNVYVYNDIGLNTPNGGVLKKGTDKDWEYSSTDKKYIIEQKPV